MGGSRGSHGCVRLLVFYRHRRFARKIEVANWNMRTRGGGRAGRLCGGRRPFSQPSGIGGHHDSHVNHHRGGRYTMNAPAITITQVRVADLLAEGERMPLYVYVIEHPDARVLVDTGMTELHPAVADLDPRLLPLSKQDLDLAAIDIIVNTHLHFDHCGGNHLFAGRPIYVQRRELDDARSEDDYTIREWVEAPGVRYVPVDGELELLPGLRLVPAPGHTRGMQMVVVETGGRPVVVGGDVAVWFGELDEPQTEGQLLVRALDPELVWLAHEDEPWRPHTV
jgi:N-acyl homoserine lactone hydrolase